MPCPIFIRKPCKAIQVGESSYAGIQRVENHLTTLQNKVDTVVVTKIAVLDFNLYEKHRQLNTQLSGLDAAFTELTPRKQKLELKIETTDDDETRELLAENLKELGTKLLSIDQQKTALRKELTVFEDDVLTLALSLYNERTADSPRLQTATTLFELGDIEGANRVLNPSDLQRDKKRHETKKALISEAQASVADEGQILAQEYLTKAKLVTLEKRGPNWFAETTRYYLDAVSLHSSFYNCFNAAYFFASHNRHGLSIEYYELALMDEENEIQRASVLNNLAALYRVMNQRTQAEEKYIEVLSIWKNLASKNLEGSEFFMQKIARTINNLAVLYAESGKQGEAEKYFFEAYDICQSLSEDFRKLNRSFVGAILNNLGKIHADKDQLIEAEKVYLKALIIYEELADVNPELYKSDVALILYNLGVLYFDNNQHRKAENEYGKSIEIQKLLVTQNPHKHLPGLAKTISALAVLHSFSDLEIDISESEKEHLESLSIWERILMVSPIAYRMDFASTLINLGFFYQDKIVAKNKSLNYSMRAFKTVYHFADKDSQAKDICKKADGVWGRWGEDLQTHIQDRQREKR